MGGAKPGQYAGAAGMATNQRGACGRTLAHGLVSLASAAAVFLGRAMACTLACRHGGAGSVVYALAGATLSGLAICAAG